MAVRSRGGLKMGGGEVWSKMEMDDKTRQGRPGRRAKGGKTGNFGWRRRWRWTRQGLDPDPDPGPGRQGKGSLM